MELRYLEIFVRVVEKKSFSLAAQEFGLTQPTISIHIKSLEQELEVKLLDRLGRSVVPTRAGELLFNYAKEIVRLKKEALLALGGFTGKMSGPLVVGGSSIPAEYILPGYIASFKNKYPDVFPSLMVADTGKVYAMVLEGLADVGVAGALIEDDRVKAIEFLEDEVILIAPKNYGKNEITKERLAKEPLITREQGSGTKDSVEHLFEKNGVTKLNFVAEMGSTQAMIAAVKNGLGLAFVSTVAVKDEILRGSLKRVSIKGVKIKRRFYVITHSQKALSPIAKIFMDFLLSGC